MTDAFQVLSDCPNCLIESAVVELMDPQIVTGVAVQASCRACGHQVECGEVQNVGRQIDDIVVAREMLSGWAQREGEEDLAMFCETNLCGVSVEDATNRLVTGQPIPSSFDVVAFLFPGMGGGGMTRSSNAEAVSTPSRTMLNEEESTGREATGEGHPSDPAKTVPRALAAVMMADGEIRRGERDFLDAVVAQLGLAPLGDDELRVWRPSELVRPDQPGEILRAMIELAYVDRQRDGSEWRVIREYGRYWRFPLADLEEMASREDHRTAPAMRRLWRALKRLLFTEKTKGKRRTS